jgi:hypothetical protein
MCIRMGWSSSITKHNYTYNVLILSHNQTWLHMTMCVCFFLLLFYPMPIIVQTKKTFVWFIWKDQTYFFKTNCSIIMLHSNTYTKDYNHSLVLVYTRGVSSYQVMINGGHENVHLSKMHTTFSLFSGGGGRFHNPFRHEPIGVAHCPPKEKPLKL